MTATMPMNTCPTTETLAEFIDGRLNGAQRRQVIVHLAECADCKSEFDMVNDVLESEPSQNVQRGNFGVTRWFVPAAAVAAAAAIVFLTPVRDYVMPSPMKGIVTAADAMRERPTKMRLAESLAYHPAKPTIRGDNETSSDVRMGAAIARIGERRTTRNLHALGVGELYNGHPDAAVAALEEAHSRDTDDVSILVDYAAARYALGARLGDKQELEAALGIFDDVLRRDADNRIALFNRGVVLEALGRDAEAMQAYRRYLAVDPSSPWAADIRDYLSLISPDPR